MLSAAAAMIAIRAKKPTGGGSDVTPNAVNWDDVSSSAPPYQVDTNSQTISGINTAIELDITFDFNDGGFYYIKNTDDPVLFSSPFTVVNGDTLKFRFEGSGGMVQFNVYNNSDPSGPTLLDTCFMELVYGPG